MSRKNIFKLPFRYDPEGQMVLDDEGTIVLNVRGWGRFQYMEHGSEDQDEFGRMVAKTLNEGMKDEDSTDQKIKKNN
jgi:hypothetical protein